MPEPSDPKDGDGDVFAYAKDHMTGKGHLLNHRGEKAVSTMSSQLAGIWNIGFGDETKWSEEYGGGSDGSGGGSSDGSSSGGGGGSELTPEELEERCRELNGDGSSGDTERNARDAAALKGTDDSSPSKEKSVTVLAIVLLVVFLGMVLVEKIFQWFYGRYVDGSNTVLRLKPVLDSATKEIAILAFVLLIGYMLLWSGMIASFEENVLGYDEDDDHLLTSLYGDVHFLLTCAMLLFIFLTSVLVLLGERSASRWSEFERHVSQAPHAVVADWCYAEKKNSVKGSVEEIQMDFLTLRMRFAPLLYRSSKVQSIPTRSNCDETTARFANFDFAEYLSFRLGKELSRILSVSVRSWLIIEILMLLLTLPLLSTWSVQCFVFGLFAFIPFLLHYMIRRKLRSIWNVAVHESKAQKVVSDMNEKLDEKYWDSDDKQSNQKSKSAEMLNAMMHNSVESESRFENLFWSGGSKKNGRALVLQRYIRLVIVLTAISAILIPMSAGIAFANDAPILAIVMLCNYLLLFVIMSQIRGVLELYVILTSVGPFRKPKVVQTIVDEQRYRFSVGIAYVVFHVREFKSSHPFFFQVMTTE